MNRFNKKRLVPLPPIDEVSLTEGQVHYGRADLDKCEIGDSLSSDSLLSFGTGEYEQTESEKEENENELFAQGSGESDNDDTELLDYEDIISGAGPQDCEDEVPKEDIHKEEKTVKTAQLTGPSTSTKPTKSLKKQPRNEYSITQSGSNIPLSVIESVIKQEKSEKSIKRLKSLANLRYSAFNSSNALDQMSKKPQKPLNESQTDDPIEVDLSHSIPVPFYINTQSSSNSASVVPSSTSIEKFHRSNMDIASSASSFYSSSSLLNENIEDDTDTNPTNANSNSSLNFDDKQVSHKNYQVNLESEFGQYSKFLKGAAGNIESSFDYEEEDNSFLDDFLDNDDKFYDAENDLLETKLADHNESKQVTISTSTKSFNIANFAKQLQSYNELFQESIRVEPPSALSIFQSIRYRSDTHATEKSVRFGHILSHKSSSIYSSFIQPSILVNRTAASTNASTTASLLNTSPNASTSNLSDVSPSEAAPQSIIFSDVPPKSATKSLKVPTNVFIDLGSKPTPGYVLESPPSPTTSDFPNKYLKKNTGFFPKAPALPNLHIPKPKNKTKKEEKINIDSNPAKISSTKKTKTKTKTEKRKFSITKWKSNLIGVVSFGKKTHFEGQIRNKSSIARLSISLT